MGTKSSDVFYCRTRGDSRYKTRVANEQRVRMLDARRSDDNGSGTYLESCGLIAGLNTALKSLCT